MTNYRLTTGSVARTALAALAIFAGGPPTRAETVWPPSAMGGETVTPEVTAKLRAVLSRPDRVLPYDATGSARADQDPESADLLLSTPLNLQESVTCTRVCTPYGCYWDCRGIVRPEFE
jgi:hypothetical protein